MNSISVARAVEILPDCINQLNILFRKWFARLFPIWSSQFRHFTYLFFFFNNLFHKQKGKYLFIYNEVPQRSEQVLSPE